MSTSLRLGREVSDALGEIRSKATSYKCVAVSSKARDLSASPLSKALMSAIAGWAMCPRATMLHPAKSCSSFGRTTRQASARST